jgi:hypothetical protein
MFRMRASQIALSLLTGLIAGTSVASASTYTYSNYNVPGEQTIQITSPNDIFGGMGQIDLIGTGSSLGNNILAWCLDVYTYLLGNGYTGGGPPAPFTYNISQLTTATQNVGFSTNGTNNLATLTASQIDKIGGLIAYGDAHIGDPNVSAATQMAIWETEYSNFTYLASSVSAATITQVTWELANVLPSDGSNIGLLTQGTDQANQTLAYFHPGSFGNSGTPGPIAGAGLPGVLFLIGFAGLIWQRRKRAPTALAA